MHLFSWLWRIAITLNMLLGAAVPFVSAAPFSAPQDEVLLKITGNITISNSGAELHLDREQLMAIDPRIVETRTPWTDGVSRFDGPLLRSVLEAAGAQGDRIRVQALNDYTVEIPLSDLQRYDVILALEQDGVPLEVRELGPVFVLYPFDEYPELFNKAVRHRSVWHVIAVEVP